MPPPNEPVVTRDKAEKTIRLQPVPNRDTTIGYFLEKSWLHFIQLDPTPHPAPNPMMAFRIPGEPETSNGWGDWQVGSVTVSRNMVGVECRTQTVSQMYPAVQNKNFEDGKTLGNTVMICATYCSAFHEQTSRQKLRTRWRRQPFHITQNTGWAHTLRHGEQNTININSLNDMINVGVCLVSSHFSTLIAIQ